MFKRTIEVSESPHITVSECRGSLTVRGGSEGQITVVVKDGDDEVELEQEDGAVSLSAAGDCTVLCPSATTLTAERVLGNLRVDGVRGGIHAGVIHGNATLRAVGPVSLDEGLGNLSAHEVHGHLEAGEVKGNVRVRALDEQLTLAEVAGNLSTEGLKGGLQAETVRGNAQLGPPFSPGMVYRVRASGNLTVWVPEEASLRLAVRADGHVHSDVFGLDVEREEGEVRGSLGDGQAVLEGDVKGNLSLRPAGAGEAFEATAGLDDLGAQIELQVNQAMAEMATRLETSLGYVDAEAIKRRVERATEQARRKAERAAERARMRAERAERRWQRASGQRPRSEEGASDEEVLRVLRMVEEGKITPEQASELLAALE